MARTHMLMICLGLAVAGCATSTPADPPPQTVLHETTLTRFDGSAVTMEELESMRYSAIATAKTIERIERELREPWAETRTPEEIVRAVAEREPSDMRLATTLWETAEPPGTGHDRKLFREFGMYSNQLMPVQFGPRARPATLELFARKLLARHDDSTPRGKLLAAWRRFSPTLDGRGDAYLASDWRFELDYVQPITVELSDSLLGPHVRSNVGNQVSVSFPGPNETRDGYSASPLLLDLLAPGPGCPVSNAVTAMADLSDKGAARLPFMISKGRRESVDDLDRRFLQAALHGLKSGMAHPEALPAGTSRFTVTFSYLVEKAEARATLSFHRLPGGWELEMFDYEPAAASLVGGSARLDLLPEVRELALRTRQG